MSIFLFVSCSEHNNEISSFDGNSSLKIASIDNLININENKLQGDPRDCCGSILQDHIDQKNLTFPEISNSDTGLYAIRDNVLSKGIRGQKYIKAYYELSSKVKNEPIKYIELTQLSSLLPGIFDAYNKFNNPNYNGVIVNTQLRDKAVNYLRLYKSKRIADKRYQDLLTALIDDIRLLANKNKGQVKQFLQ